MDSRIFKIAAAVIIAVMMVAVAFSALTFPRVMLNFPVAFSVGFDSKQQEFEVPILHDKVQVSVTIASGTSLWRATIVDVNGEELWSHATAQGDQTTYHSEWVSLPNGRYNFTFSTIGGALNAEISATSKGGFW